MANDLLSPSKAAADLEKVKYDIATAEARVGQQRSLIDDLRHEGHDTAEAERLLRTMEDVLMVFRDHQQVIEQELEIAKEQERRR